MQKPKSVRARRRSAPLPAVLAACAALTALAGVSRATPVMDQSNSALPTGNFTTIRSGATAAQTFTVGFAGTLTGVSVVVDPRGTPAANLVLEVQGTVAGVPDGIALATASVPPYTGSNPLVFFDLSSASLPVTAGSVLALVLKSNAALGNDYLARAVPGNLYARGEFTNSSGAFATGGGWDGIFKTWVEPANTPGPGLSDQANLQTPTGNFAAIATGLTAAQTFTVGRTGVLTRIDVVVDPRNTPVLDLVLEVRGTTGGVPNANVLASASVAPFTGVNPVVTFDLSPYNLAVVQGDVLAFVLRSNAAGGTDYLARAVPGDTYAGGEFTNSTGGFATGGNWDAIFETFVHDATPPVVQTLGSWPRTQGTWFQIGSRPRLYFVASDLIGVCSIRILLSRNGHAGPFTLLHTLSLCAPQAGTDPGLLATAAEDDTLFWDWDVTGPATSQGVLRFEAEDEAGNVGAEESEEFDILETLAAHDPAPPDYALSPVAPNPMGARGGAIEYSLARGARIRLSLHDVLGRERAVLADDFHVAGRHSARLDPRALGLSAGMYFARLHSAAGTIVRRVVIAW